MINTLIKEETEARCASHQVLVITWEESDPDVSARGPKPPSLALVIYANIKKYHSALQREYSIQSTNFTSNKTRYYMIFN